MSIRLSAVLPAALLLTGIAPMALAVDHAPFNTRLATQTFVPSYQFEAPAKDKLRETVDRIQELGTTAIKFEMSSRTNTTYGLSLAGVNNLTQLFNHPTYQDAFARPFHTFALWIYPFTVNSLNNNWKDGYTGFGDYPYDPGDPDTEAKREYEEIYNLVVAMRNNASLSGKTLLLGHWEGDNALTNGGADPGATAITGMREWLRNRQRAIDDAKAATPSSTVNVYHYVEVNNVLQTQFNPSLFTVLRNVLNDSNVKVDLVSYSCYDVSTVAAPPTVPDATTLNFFNWSLNEINSQIADNLTGNYPGGRPVFIGEIGAPLTILTESQRVDRMRLLNQAAMSWGCPYIFYWQMYDNEQPNGDYWLITDTNTKAPIYFEMQDGITKAHTLKNLYRTWLNRNPTDAEMESFGGSYSSFSTSTALNTILNSPAYASAVSNTQYVDLIATQIYGDINHPIRATLLAQLGSQSRSDVLDNALNNAAFQARTTNANFARYLHEKTWGVASPLPANVAATETLLQSTPRATVWRQFLNAAEFHAAELDLISDNAVGSPAVLAKHFFDGLTFESSVAEWLAY
jgi:hypothetical protein